MPDEQVYFSQDKDALLRSKGFDPAMVYGKFQELGKFRNPSFSTSPLVETPIQVGSGYEYNDVNSFGEQLLNSYINQVYLTTPKGIVNFIPTVGLAIAKDNTSAAKFFDSWIKGATDFFDKGKQDVTPTESYLKSGSPLAFASSLGQGLGFVASMFAGSAVKAPAALGSFGKYAVGAAVSTPVLQSMYYEEAVNSGLDKKDAAIFSSVLAPISALSEYVGFEMMGNAITKPIISQVRKKALLEGVKEFAAKGATKAAFYDAASMSSKVYAQSMKELFSNLAVRGTRGAFAEGSQEFAQSYLEEGAKQVYDTYFAKGAQKKFGADVATNFKGAIEDAFFGGVIGAVLGGGGGAIYNPVFEESLFNVLDKAKNKEYAADKLKKDITAYVKKGKITEQEAAYGNQLVDGITNFVKTELPKTITDPIARFQALRLTDVKNDLTASLSGNPSLLPDYVPMQIERVESALKQIGNSNTPIADFNGLLMELVQIENEVKQKNGWNEIGQQGAEDTSVETEEAGIGEGVAADNQGIEDIGAAELEPIDGVIDGVNEGVNEDGQKAGQDVQAELKQYEDIFSRNQAKLKKLRTSKLKKGETQESRDAAISNLEQQEMMVADKINALKQQLEVKVEPDKTGAEVRLELDEQTTKNQQDATKIEGAESVDVGEPSPAIEDSGVIRGQVLTEYEQTGIKILKEGGIDRFSDWLSNQPLLGGFDALRDIANKVGIKFPQTQKEFDAEVKKVGGIDTYMKQLKFADFYSHFLSVSDFSPKEYYQKKNSEIDNQISELNEWKYNHEKYIDLVAKQSGYKKVTEANKNKIGNRDYLDKVGQYYFSTGASIIFKTANDLVADFVDEKINKLNKTKKSEQFIQSEENRVAEIRKKSQPSRNGKKVGEGNEEKEEVAEAQEEKEVVSPTEQVEQPAEFEEVKQAKEKFYKHTEDKGYVEVKRAKPVYIFGTEKAFYVKEGKEFVVSDAITGAEIGRGSTLNNAVASAEENAGSVQNLESARERFTDAYGKSPYAKLQEEFSFTQSIINNAMDAAEDGIQDMTLDDMEDKGIIKRDCE